MRAERAADAGRERGVVEDGAADGMNEDQRWPRGSRAEANERAADRVGFGGRVELRRELPWGRVQEDGRGRQVVVRAAGDEVEQLHDLKRVAADVEEVVGGTDMVAVQDGGEQLGEGGLCAGGWWLSWGCGLGRGMGGRKGASVDLAAGVERE